MTAKELITRLEERYPVEKAAAWDNPGLQTGRRNKEIKKVYLALDATDEVIRDAVEWGADLLLTHHPMTMEGIKKVSTDTLAGKRFMELIRNDICCYAMHTNYDVVEMAPLSGEMMKLQKPEILERTGVDPVTGDYEGFGRVGSLVRPVTLEECAGIVKTIFKLDHVKVFGDTEMVVQRVAISPGSGKSMIAPAIRAKAQVLISGDIGHHEGLDAVDNGLAIIDAGHYGLEHIFMEQMKGYLEKNTRGLEIRTAKIRSPFRIL